MCAAEYCENTIIDVHRRHLVDFTLRVVLYKNWKILTHSLQNTTFLRASALQTFEGMRRYIEKLLTSPTQSKACKWLLTNSNIDSRYTTSPQESANLGFEQNFGTSV